MRKAGEVCWHKEVLETANAAYAKMREDPIAAKKIDEEMLEWDVNLLDGLKNV